MVFVSLRRNFEKYFFIFRLSRCSSYGLRGLTHKIKKGGSITYYKQKNSCVKGKKKYSSFKFRKHSCIVK